jgi:hypothetical protein
MGSKGPRHDNAFFCFNVIKDVDSKDDDPS